ncbi:SdrD B-like domain-containing protein [Lentzea sp. CA-135723]|uniref:SdrD B-like domain-containing protein n=1 Tax=Lentzea sp. CA-135723 TaxID=3239950 RepID=UPI003D8C73F4
MKKLFAAATTAAIALTAGTPALAQDATISIEGQAWLDRNTNRAYDEGEVLLANEPGGTIVKDDSGEVVATFATDANGRYAVKDLPAGKYRVEHPVTTRYNFLPEHRTTEGGTVHLRFYGSWFEVNSFLDTNLDFVRQPDEELLDAGTLNGKPLPKPGEDGKVVVNDLPFGDFVYAAADHSARNLRLADGATRTKNFRLEKFDNAEHLDARHVAIKGDLAVEMPVLTPSKDVYVRDEEADVVIKITNKGEAPEKASFVLASYYAKTLSMSDNVVSVNDRGYEWQTREPLAPGASVDVKMRVKFVEAKDQTLHVIVQPSRFFKEPFGDNVAIRKIEVVEPGAETTTSAPTSTAAPATTDQAVAKAGNSSGLASTGASPLGFLGLGALLLAAGASAFFVARRRRS